MWRNKYYAWMKECADIIEKKNKRDRNNIHAAVLSCMSNIVQKHKKNHTLEKVHG